MLCLLIGVSKMFFFRIQTKLTGRANTDTHTFSATENKNCGTYSTENNKINLFRVLIE